MIASLQIISVIVVGNPAPVLVVKTIGKENCAKKMAVLGRAGNQDMKLLTSGLMNKEEQLWCVLNAAVVCIVKN